MESLTWQNSFKKKFPSLEHEKLEEIEQGMNPKKFRAEASMATIDRIPYCMR